MRRPASTFETWARDAPYPLRRVAAESRTSSAGAAGPRRRLSSGTLSASATPSEEWRDRPRELPLARCPTYRGTAFFPQRPPARGTRRPSCVSGERRRATGSSCPSMPRGNSVKRLSFELRGSSCDVRRSRRREYDAGGHGANCTPGISSGRGSPKARARREAAPPEGKASSRASAAHSYRCSRW